VVNPISAMPVFLALTTGSSDHDRRKQALKACFYMVIILVTFFLAGTYIMNFFGISLEGIRIAGGLMIMRASYSLLNPNEGGRKLTAEDEAEAITKADISFSPLAMPLLSGPGSIAVVLGLAASISEWEEYMMIILAIISTALVSWIILLISPIGVKYLGKSGMTAMTRMMGFLGLTIGVQFIINGVLPLLRG
jgi:multiple antibiotic resistance protein